MYVEFVHQMPDVSEAYQAVLRVDREPFELVESLGIILLVRDDGSPDWYFFVNLNDPNSEDKIRILDAMDKAGVRTDRRIADLLVSRHFGDCFSGRATQIRTGLELLVRDYRFLQLIRLRTAGMPLSN
jgi:hypothetical protein